MQNLVDKSKRLPLYLQLSESLERRIKDGDLKPGDALPPENELSKQLGVSPVTVKNGLKILVDKGLIRRISGRGTFVSAPREWTQPPSVSRTAEVELREGMYGLISLPSASNEGWKGSVISGMEKALQTNNSRLRFIPHEPDEPLRLPRHDWGRIQGLAVVAASDSDVSQALIEAEKASLNLVIISDCAPDVPANAVDCDQARAGRDAARHLVECRYSHFIHLASGSERMQNARREGFVRELQMLGVPDSKVSIITAPAGSTAREFGANTAAELPLIKEGVGIFASDDEIAAALVSKCAQKGRYAGADYGVVGCGDVPEFRHMGITTIAFPYEKAGEVGAKRLMGLLDETQGTLRFSLWPKLVERGSTSSLTM
ncbi:MAG TPA: GntR family transcriptional regulator [Planctomycetota bacterium]|nr:GntR family transcriptional regulator [Planctomycetota bacterium]